MLVVYQKPIKNSYLNYRILAATGNRITVLAKKQFKLIKTKTIT